AKLRPPVVFPSLECCREWFGFPRGSRLIRIQRSAAERCLVLPLAFRRHRRNEDVNGTVLPVQATCDRYAHFVQTGCNTTAFAGNRYPSRRAGLRKGAVDIGQDLFHGVAASA